MDLRLFDYLLALALLAWLIVAKSDKQSVHILEGKLHRLGKPVDGARPTYKRHARTSSVVQLATGLCFVFVAVVTPTREIAVASGILGALLLVLGIAGRFQTFRFADQELTK